VNIAVKTAKLQQPPAAESAKCILRQAGWLGLGVVLLTLAYAPVGQFYLAWVGMVPWLVMLGSGMSLKTRFGLSWLAGTVLIIVNMWWLCAVNVLGMFALSAYCGFYWGVAALVIGGARLLEFSPAVSVVAIASVWTALEFARGRLLTGFPWLFIGHTQSPNLPLCQIADTLGVYGVSFWVVMINAVIALGLIRRKTKPIIPAAILVAVASVLSLSYGFWRMNQPTIYAGPRVLVVQCNYAQSNSGDKGASDDELVRFHVDTTRDAIQRANQDVNLAVWPETTLPPVNRQALAGMSDKYRDFVQKAIVQISSLAKTYHTGILSGGRFWDKWNPHERDGNLFMIPDDSRNSTYLFQPDGTLGDQAGERYDKLHLVPFGEFIPFKQSVPWVYNIFLHLGPQYYADYELQDGSDNGLTVFQLQDAAGAPTWRFVTPICFEDIDGPLCAAMFRPGADGRKRADFMVNVTNDGWFLANENSQHLQAAIFRSIENRAPTVRSVNTGISGFIDSVGRTSGLVPVRTVGTSVLQLQLDRRITFYSRFGDIFAWACVFGAILAVAGGLIDRKPIAQVR
jgi:apolipoprotein N-acyltransferase